VTRARFLERPALIPVPGRVLEALSHRGRRLPPLLIVPPPPGEGGMDHVVALELAWAASRAGHPTLRFNFRGVGASPGPKGDAASRAKDIEAALAVLAENSGTSSVALVALGASAPDALRLAAAHPGVLGVALANPDGLSAETLADVRRPLLVVLEADAATAAALESGVGNLSGTVVRAATLPEVGHAVARWLGRLATP
jgi:uncharacterized protein